MGISKLWAALKGASNEVVEAIEDNQAIRILDQEIREAKEELRKSDESLTKIMAKRKLQERKVAGLKTKVSEMENHALAANDKGDEALAIECAERASELEADLSTEQNFLDSFFSSEKKLLSNIRQAKNNVRRMDQQIEQVKATEAVQKAQVAVSSRHLGANNKVKTAISSLDRLKQRQEERAAELEAASELAETSEDSDLETRLKAAGIKPGTATSGSNKLAALLKAKQNN